MLNNITYSKGEKYTNNPLSDGFYGFCIEGFNHNPIHNSSFYEYDFDILRNHINHEYIGDYLKIFLYKYDYLINTTDEFIFANYILAIY
ncbi:hypothetical protein BGI41_01025 [Methanobrevibacter sp. 87.7]|uniref:hypothetical protein n=1 Tax=Methanobrevibacter sp. 87.7 TaxID=387957 RepID=UPI000B4FEFE8|nr:hypothetical protein [Methanobrevibacter sp. 87.7]OWT33708.1 hypothetical protein BGI41_01025 [Methanobrevibacter sp. 87.7]